jgi:hypothetical protein
MDKNAFLAWTSIPSLFAEFGKSTVASSSRLTMPSPSDGVDRCGLVAPTKVGSVAQAHALGALDIEPRQ